MRRKIFFMVILSFLGTYSIISQTFLQDAGAGITQPLVDDLDYIAPLSMDFDDRNRPYMINNVLYPGMPANELYRVRTLRNGVWEFFSYRTAIEAELNPGESLDFNITDSDRLRFVRDGEMTMDGYNNLYAIITVKVANGSSSSREFMILYASGIGEDNFNGSFKVHRLPPGTTQAELEVRTSFNDFTNHPPVIMYISDRVNNIYPSGPSWLFDIWGNMNIIAVDWTANREDLDLSSVIQVSDRSGFLNNHSGGGSYAVTKGDTTFFTWLRHPLDPEVDRDGESVIFVNSLNRNAKRVGPNRQLVVHPEGRANSHHQPAIAIDESGFIHVLTGSHTRNGFLYNKTLNPLDISSWTPEVEVGTDRTYAALLIDNLGVIYAPYRGDRPYRQYMQTGDVANGLSGEGELFIDNPPCDDIYRAFYNKLYKDKPSGGNDRVYMSWSTNCNASETRTDFYRTMAFTDDQGGSWRIPTRYDLSSRNNEGKSVQRITFDPVSPSSNPFDINADSDVSLPVTYEIISGNNIATISGNTITPTGTGQIVVSASNNGNNTYYGDFVTTVINIGSGSGLENTITPVADAFVRNGSSANSNFGSDSRLIVKNSGSNFTRESYLRFDLSGIQGSINSARLELVPESSTSPGSTDIQVRYVSNDSWSESGITWNNRPGASTVLDTKTGSSSIMTFDITDQVRTELSGDGQISLRLQSTDSGNFSIVYSSREAVSNLRPRLVVSVQPVSGSALTPEADAFVRDGSFSSDNFGSDSRLIVKNDALGFKRESYLRFDLSSVQGTITSARLEMTVENSGSPSSTDMRLRFVSDDSWSESGITWLNKPGATTTLDTQQGNGSTMSFDVTEQAETERLGDGKLSLRFQSTNEGNFSVSYNSREASTTGLRPRLVITVASPSGSALVPEADAFVRDGSFSSDNFGSDSRLIVKNDALGFKRESYLRFDLSSVQGTITSARLEMTVENSGSPSSTDMRLRFVSDDSWSESGITWLNKPGATTTLDTQQGSSSTTRFDVTEQAETERLGDGKLSLRFQSTNEGNFSVSYNSREASTTGLRPRLIITVASPSGSALVPEADAFVRDGSFSSDNFGSDSRLIVKNDALGFKRESYLRFDLSSVQGTITSARLEMTVENFGSPSSTDMRLRFVSDDSWSESGITWLNKPGATTTLDTQQGSSSTTRFDVTEQAETERLGDGKLSLRFQSTNEGNFSVSYNSREASTTVLRPRLIIQTSSATALVFRQESLEEEILKEQPLSQEFLLYPNPVIDIMNVASDQVIQRAMIIDLSGQKVMELDNLNDKSMQVDTRALPSGVYILKMIDETGAEHNRKFIK